MSRGAGDPCLRAVAGAAWARWLGTLPAVLSLVIIFVDLWIIHSLFVYRGEQL